MTRTIKGAGRAPLLFFCVLLLAGCATEGPYGQGHGHGQEYGQGSWRGGPGPRYNLSGYPDAYKEGFADGCSQPFRRNEKRYEDDQNYMNGWNDGLGACPRRR